MKSTLIAAALSTALLAPTAAFAASYTIDETHAHAAFKVSHLGFSHTIGQFKEISGTLQFDEADPAASSVSVTINTASVDSANEARDEHLRKADFLNVEAFPTMTFASTDVEVTGENTGKLTGDLTLLGVTQPVTLDVTFNQAGPHPFDPSKIVAGFSATGEINRSDFGMAYASPAIGETVELTIEVEASKD
jgi:polyisoprenoid-binding protein YceI